MAIDSIIVGVGPGDADRSTALASTVVDVADPTGATVTLVHAFTQSEYTNALSNVSSEADITPNDLANRHVTVREIGAELEDADVEYAVSGPIGDAGGQVVDVAEDEDADLVIVGGRKRSPSGKAVFGSTAQAIMLSAPCPVTLVRGSR